MKQSKTSTNRWILLSLVWVASAAGAARHLYIDPVSGNDNWDGSQPSYTISAIGPKRTLTAAQTMVRQWITSGLNEDVYVELRGGSYELAATLNFTLADNHPTYAVTWRNYNGENVRLSGGKTITANWTYDAAKGYYKTSIPEVASGTWWFRDLYRDDQRMIRSRWPNAPTDTLQMAWSPADRLPSDSNLLTLMSVNPTKTELAFNAAPPQTLSATDKAEAVLFRLWTSLRTVIDHSNGATLYLAEPMTGCLVIQPGEQYTRKGFLENAPSFIDQDNEWALDTAGYLYYRGTDPTASVFRAPNIHTLIVVQGSGVSNRVRNLHFVGLTLEHANFDFPNGGLNWYPRQAGVPCDYVHIPAAVRFTYTQNCSLEQCNVVRCNGVGVHLDTGSWADRIERCTLFDIGNTGIILGNTAEELVSPTRTAYGRVENNSVSRCGRGDFSSLGIGEMFMRGAFISHNEVFDLPNTGISLGWHWWSSTTNANAQNIEVSYNHIYQVCQMMDDGGGIYTLDDLTGTQISHNLIQRIGWSGQTCSGIYTDEGSKNYTIFGNVADTIYDGWCHFLHFENFDGIVQNNIYMNGQRREIYAAMREGYADYFASLSRNILYQKNNNDSYLSYNGSWNNSAEYDADYNCYHHPFNPTKTFSGFSWSAWQAKGNDLHSYYQQDPMFQDTTHANKNYLLQAGSPLLVPPMNFQQVQVQNAGVQPANTAVESFAGGDSAVNGTVNGSFIDTRKSDGGYQKITEVLSSGPSSTRYSYLEHKWLFHLTAANQHTFWIEAYHTANSEGDDFIFAYSADDVTYTEMLTVTKTNDDNTNQSYLLPPSLTGTVFVRVKDANQSSGKNVLDSLFVDRMFMRSEKVEDETPPMHGDIEIDGKVNLYDVAKLSRYWQNPYTMPTLLEIAEAWLTELN